jgi:hypothetical protein
VNVFDRFRRRADDPLDTAVVERTLLERFAFLEEEKGFELARSERLPDGARAAYKNLPAGQAIMIFARATRGAWAGVGQLDAAGRLRPVNRDTIELGEWRPLAAVDIGSVETLDDAIETLALAVGGTRG